MKKQIKYLIAEDDLASIIIVKQELMKYGFVVKYKATDSRQCISEYLSSDVFDFIISDHQMPSLSSFEVLELRNNISPDTPFIILTMDIPKELEYKAYSLGCDSVVNKKDIKSLPAIVTYCVQGKPKI